VREAMIRTIKSLVYIKSVVYPGHELGVETSMLLLHQCYCPWYTTAFTFGHA
jgi:hypothetical protein